MPKFRKKMTNEDEMPFGEHKGKKMKSVPGPYLMWLYREGMWSSPLKLYIENRFGIHNIGKYDPVISGPRSGPITEHGGDMSWSCTDCGMSNVGGSWSCSACRKSR